jgi:hypothetical protein
MADDLFQLLLELMVYVTVRLFVFAHEQLVETEIDDIPTPLSPFKKSLHIEDFPSLWIKVFPQCPCRYSCDWHKHDQGWR